MSIGLLAYLNGRFYLAGTHLRSLIENKVSLAATGDVKSEKNGEFLNFNSFFTEFSKRNESKEIVSKQLYRRLERGLCDLINHSPGGKDIELHCLFAGFLPSGDKPFAAECVIRYGVVTINDFDLQDVVNAQFLGIGNSSSIDRLILGADPQFLTLGLRKIRKEILLPHYAGIIERDKAGQENYSCAICAPDSESRIINLQL
jgi:hypothetical protein